MGHEIELRKYHLEHLSHIWALDDWVVGILETGIFREEFIKP